ncbi:MAG: NAD(P)H-dependent glycerol-3-phosphate dehydrogenase [Pseudomonadota bacterium]
MTEQRIVVIGAGAWGTALAIVLADAGNEVRLLARDAAHATAITQIKRNDKYLPGIELPGRISAVTSWDEIEISFNLVLVAIPFQTARAALGQLKNLSRDFAGVMFASKGIELNTHTLAHELVASELGSEMPFAMVSGPNFAKEVAARLPAAITIASANSALLDSLVAAFHTNYFRPYSSDDVIGVEVGGAVKNVIAIAAGIADGLRLGANARAALVTRGLAEIARWGGHCGGRSETFMGLSGLGDLVLTCTDDLSRNRRFGLSLANGNSVAKSIEDIGVVEGAKTALALDEVANRDGIEMPIAKQVARVVKEEISPQEAVSLLMSRDLGSEIAN